jgi:hypothetical protein
MTTLHPGPSTIDHRPLTMDPDHLPTTTTPTTTMHQQPATTSSYHRPSTRTTDHHQRPSTIAIDPDHQPPPRTMQLEHLLIQQALLDDAKQTPSNRTTQQIGLAIHHTTSQHQALEIDHDSARSHLLSCSRPPSN